MRRKMRKVLVALIGLLMIMGLAMPGLADENVADIVKEEPVITKEDMKTAKPGEGLLIELATEPEGIEPWQKYFSIDVDHNENEDSQILWTRIGMRRGAFDISLGWNQKFNEPEEEERDKGIWSFSLSYAW